MRCILATKLAFNFVARTQRDSFEVMQERASHTGYIYTVYHIILIKLRLVVS